VWKPKTRRDAAIADISKPAMQTTAAPMRLEVCAAAIAAIDP
jgi:hypothetical protein